MGSLEDLATNLRLVCSYYPSIAHICRRLSLSRTQFNRYLAAQNTPSPHTLRRLGDFFGFELAEWWLPPEQFQVLLQGRVRFQTHKNQGVQTLKALDQLTALARQTLPSLSRYAGVYNEFYRSMSSPDHIMRSVLVVVPSNGGMRYVRWESLALAGKKKITPRCRYEGGVFLLGDRIFMLDIESLMQNEITHTIYFPCYQNRLHRLTGLKLGVSSIASRIPNCVRSVLQPLPEGQSLRQAIRASGWVSPDELAHDADLLHCLDNTIASSTPHFAGVIRV